jgi:urate oxidase
MKFDTDRSPLGALKKSQIKAGFEILSKIEELLLKNETGGEYRNLVNDYLTKIPHSFGKLFVQF